MRSVLQNITEYSGTWDSSRRSSRLWTPSGHLTQITPAMLSNANFKKPSLKVVPESGRTESDIAGRTIWISGIRTLSRWGLSFSLHCSALTFDRDYSISDCTVTWSWLVIVQPLPAHVLNIAGAWLRSCVAVHPCLQVGWNSLASEWVELYPFEILAGAPNSTIHLDIILSVPMKLDRNSECARLFLENHSVAEFVPLL